MHAIEQDPQLELDLSFSAEQSKFENLIDASPDVVQSAFETEGKRVCSCVDEGAQDGSLRLAGAGILHPDGPEAVAQLLRQQNIDEVSSHDNCGAAKEAYYRAHGLSESATVEQADIDAFAEAWATDVARRAGLTATHQRAVELHRPADRHDAVAIYLDGTGETFRQQVLDGPKGFVVSTKGISSHDVMGTVDFVHAIARGDHGFGERFTADHPMRIILLGEIDPDIRQQLATRTVNDPAMSVSELQVPAEITASLVEAES